MRPRFLTVLVLVCCCLGSATALAERRPRSAPVEGFEIMGGAGLNVCMASDDADCDAYDPSVAFMIAPGYRFNSLLGLYLDFGVGWLATEPLEEYPEAEVTHTSIYFMPTLRLFAATPARFLGVARNLEFFGGLGVGFSSMSTGMEQGGETAYIAWSSFGNVKLEAGFGLEVARGFFLGLALDSIFNVDGSGELCYKSFGYDEKCMDLDSDNLDADIADLLQVFLFGKFRF